MPETRTDAPTPEDYARDLAADLAVLHGRAGPALIAVMGAAVRRARAAEAERDALIGLTSDQVDELLDRFDQTAPHIQRDIAAAFCTRAIKAEDERDKLRAELAAARATAAGLAARVEAQSLALTLAAERRRDAS